MARLKELEADVERREKQQAAVIESQAKRLEELEKLYRDEVVLPQARVQPDGGHEGQDPRVCPRAAHAQGMRLLFPTGLHRCVECHRV